MLGDELIAKEPVGAEPQSIGARHREALRCDMDDVELEGASKPETRVYSMGGKWWVRQFGSTESCPVPFKTRKLALAAAIRNEEAVRERGVTDADEATVVASLVSAPEKDGKVLQLKPKFTPTGVFELELPAPVKTRKLATAIGNTPAAVLEVLEYLNASGVFLPSDLLEDGLPEAFVARLTRYVPGKDGKLTKTPGIYGIDLLRALAAEVGADTSYSSKVFGREVEAEALIGEIREKIAGGK